MGSESGQRTKCCQERLDPSMRSTPPLTRTQYRCLRVQDFLILTTNGSNHRRHEKALAKQHSWASNICDGAATPDNVNLEESVNAGLIFFAYVKARAAFILISPRGKLATYKVL